MVEIVYERICTACHRDPCICAGLNVKQAADGTPVVQAGGLFERVLADDPDTVGEIDDRMLENHRAHPVLSATTQALIRNVEETRTDRIQADYDRVMAAAGVPGKVLSGCGVRAAAQMVDAEAMLLKPEPFLIAQLPSVVVDCPHCGGGIQLSVSKTKV